MKKYDFTIDDLQKVVDSCGFTDLILTEDEDNFLITDLTASKPPSVKIGKKPREGTVDWFARILFNDEKYIDSKPYKSIFHCLKISFEQIVQFRLNVAFRDFKQDAAIGVPAKRNLKRKEYQRTDNIHSLVNRIYR